MDRNALAGAMRDIGCRFHLIKSVGLKAAHVLVAAGRPIHLDPVRTLRQLLARRALDLCHAIRPAWIRLGLAWLEWLGGDVQSASGDEHAGSHHRTSLDQVTHREVIAIPGAEIAHARDAALERV